MRAVYEVLFSDRAKIEVATHSTEDAINRVKKYGNITSVKKLMNACDLEDAWVYGYNKTGLSGIMDMKKIVRTK